MNSNAGRIAKKLAHRKRRIEKRLQAARDTRFVRMAAGAPAVLSSTGLKYELAQKTQAIVYGGVPLMLRVARESGLIDAIDSSVPIRFPIRPRREISAGGSAACRCGNCWTRSTAHE